jgi:hypothetical protein
VSPSPSPTLRPCPDPQSLTHRPPATAESPIYDPSPIFFPILRSPIPHRTHRRQSLSLTHPAQTLSPSPTGHRPPQSLRSPIPRPSFSPFSDLRSRNSRDHPILIFGSRNPQDPLTLTLKSQSLDLSLLYAAKQGTETQKLSKLSSSFRWEASKDRWAESRFWALENGMGLER